MDAPAVNPHRIEYLTSKARLLAGSKRLCGDIYAWAASAEGPAGKVIAAIRSRLGLESCTPA